MSALTASLIKVKKASVTLGLVSDKKIKTILNAVATAIVAATPKIIQANKKDLAIMEQGTPLYARLILTQKKIKMIAKQMRDVAKFPSPINRVLEQRTLANGLKLQKVSVPLGVVAVIYESRPNVTADIFALCFKSGNACVLKGGKEALHSNRAIIAVIHSVLKKHGIDSRVASLVMGGREVVQEILTATKYVDLAIPRGSASLIHYVRDNATVPVIETGAGVVHTFVDASADTVQAAKIIYNAKTSRPAACNALDTLLVHEKKLKDLPALIKLLANDKVELFADSKSFAVLKEKYRGQDVETPPLQLRQAKPEHFGTEFLSLKLSIKTVKNLDEALVHIARYSTKHSEAILSKDKKNIERFLKEVDAAAAYANAATTFTDGGEFGLGAEIGISTQKLHARGPMGLEHLVSYKWIARGSGQVRNTCN